MTKPEQAANDDTRLREVDSHFAFGENWASYARGIHEGKIAAAVEALQRLIDPQWLRGARFLDIGSGSGLHSLAALRSGVGGLLALDIDPNSVATTRAVLGRHAAGANWQAEERSVFALDPATLGTFDIVYSWGVLHHTGAMYEALRRAAALVAPGGLFVFALYRKTSMCGFWKVEKRLYAKAPRWVQRLVQHLFVAAYRLAFWRSIGPPAKFEAFLQGYRTRGMDWYHDIHDWLGGYPYESISPDEVAVLMGELGFALERQFVHETKGRSALFGSGCDEFVYRAKARP
jgi:SAM-dependent methyltransferase